MHPMYMKAEGDSLRQGDIIDRERLEPALKGHQDYFILRADFDGYCVLTQTCDLVVGRSVEFIQLAVIRNLLTVFSAADTPTRRSDQLKSFLKDVLRQEYNDNKRGFFYLRPEPSAGINPDSVVDLRTILTLHSQHYKTIHGARKLSMGDVTANKLGWMAGQLFSRIPTPNWPELESERLNAEVNDLLARIRATPAGGAIELTADEYKKSRRSVQSPDE